MKTIYVLKYHGLTWGTYSSIDNAYMKIKNNSIVKPELKPSRDEVHNAMKDPCGYDGPIWKLESFLLNA